MKPGPRNLITDVEGLRVGNADDGSVKSGVTVLAADRPITASVHVMGGAPGTRETDLLALADEGTSRRDNLEAAIDDLHARLGEDALQSGRQFTRKHRPERDATRQRPSIESLSGPDDGDQQG